MYTKIEVIISDSPVLLATIQSNLNPPCQNVIEVVGENNLTQDLKGWQKLKQLSKIDLLLLKLSNPQNLLPYFDKVKTIINLSQKPLLIQNEVFLSKPIKLEQFISLINYERSNSSLFTILKEWAYDERTASLRKANEKILLTAKENAVLKYLLLQPEYKANKQDLLTQIWFYSKNTDTNTIDTHLYRLRQKLPKNLLQVNNTNCFLRLY